MKKMLALTLLLASLTLLAGCDFYGTTTEVTTAETQTITITSTDELVAMNTTDDYVLGVDLDLGGIEWIPVGTADDPFTGDFDGQGHTVSGFQITDDNGGFVGLFGSVTGNIADLSVADFTIDVETASILYVGGLVAYTVGNLTGCSASGSIVVENTKSNSYIGLLAGYAASYTTSTMTIDEFVASAVSDCSATGTITASSENFLFVGGLVGKTFNIILTDDSAVATISASATVYRVYAGGLAGHNYGGILKDYEDELDDTDFETVRCYADATIAVVSNGTKASVGGLFGYEQDAYVEDCFARLALDIEGTTVDVGGLFGELWYGTVADSVARLSLVSADVDGVFGLSGIAGFLRDGTTLDNVYRLIESSVDSTGTEGSAVTAADLADTSWYETNLGWTTADFDLATVVGILS
jgi:hypothetical protein